MNKRYHLKHVDGCNGIWHINQQLNDAFWSNGYVEFNKELHKHGLCYTVDAAKDLEAIPPVFNLYEVIDEQKFMIFLLEYSDKIEMKEYEGI